MNASATRLRRARCLTLVLGLIGTIAGRAHAQTTPTQPDATWSVAAINLTRFESWRYFEPRPGGGEPDHSFLGTPCVSRLEDAGGERRSRSLRSTRASWAFAQPLERLWRRARDKAAVGAGRGCKTRLRKAAGHNQKNPLVADPAALTRMSNAELVEQAGSEGVELTMWLAMRGAMTRGPSVVHSHYHIPVWNTAAGVSSCSRAWRRCLSPCSTTARATFTRGRRFLQPSLPVPWRVSNIRHSADCPSAR